MGVRSMGRLPEQRIERFVRSAIDGLSITLKEPCPRCAAKRDGAACDFEPRALAKAENGRRVLFVEFADTLFASFVSQGRGRVGVDKMGINLKRDEA